MKFNPIPLIAGFLLAYTASGQIHKSTVENEEKFRVSLRSGSFIPAKNIGTASFNSFTQKLSRSAGRSFVVIQFETLPNEKEKIQLEQSGIELLEYVTGNAYTASVTTGLSETLLKQVNARAVVELTPEQKTEPSLAKGILPAYAIKTAGTIDVSVSFPASYNFETVARELKAKNIDIVATSWKDYRIIGLRIATNRLRELASFSFIEYVEVSPKEDEPLNDKSNANSRGNVLRSSLPGQRNLSGKGVTIGVGDDSNPTNHIDYYYRIINRAPIPGGNHGAHVLGTVGGAGIVEEKYTGFAPKSVIISQAFSNILVNAPTYVQDDGMVITNNSYGNIVNDCATFGVYDLYSRAMDQQMLRMPQLQHVFAAGNSGTYTCAPYLPGFSNVLGGYQTAKNIISVANGSETGLISPSSSKGPVRDGRIKPEITAQGVSIISTYPGSTYGISSGTSMASPAVAGGLALLYERYRQLHGGANPPNSLMKALLCNGATDMGIPGPDYTFGFGWMNLLRSAKMLENNNYYTATVNANATNTHNITLPAGISRLKVMLYWNDSAAAVLAKQALVNDLDLQVLGPGATIYYPQLLDTVPGNVNAAATTGADHINNIEQVVISNPAAGAYTFSVKGTALPFSSQYGYTLVFDTISVSATLTYPLGGDRLKSGESMYISWDASIDAPGDFTLQYTIDNGATWTNIATNIAGNLRQFQWTIPSVNTDQARMRIIHNGTGIENTTPPFVIMGVPALSLAPVQCEGYISLSWPPVAGATDYEVMMMIGGDEMLPVGTTTATNYIIPAAMKDSFYWVSVRARINGNPGRRAPAVLRQPNTGSCAGSISDNDLKADAIVSPVATGRKQTSSELSNNMAVTIRIKNLDDAVTSGNIPVAYRINNGAWINEIITAPAIAAGATFNYTFSIPADLSVTGSYNIQAVVSYPPDPVHGNDTLSKQFKQLDNQPIDLSTDFLDNFETAPVQSFILPQTGLEGLDRYDFNTTTQFGRIRSFVNSGIAYSGSKALTLDTWVYYTPGTTDSLKATFNLAGYNAATDDIRLDFMFKQHGQVANAANRVWIRGNDQQPWIPVYDLYANQADRGLFKRSSSIELSDTLAASAQSFGTSFQVKWGQWGVAMAADNENGAGYTFDDIHLYRVTNDIQMTSIDTPVVASCGLQNNVPVRITIRNSANNTITNIPVSFKIDNNTAVTEIIPSIAGNTSITYTFTATTNHLAALGIHTVKTWADLSTDTYRLNDTVTAIINNSPIITSFPYLQNFESGPGSWFTGGKNSSWEYGTPASGKINRAANGSKAWKTRLSGSYNDNELSYLYSPCFNLTGMTNPTLSVSIALDMEDCGSSLCDAAYAEYSLNGTTWTKLGSNGTGTNWYNRNYSGNPVWSIQNYTRWHVATAALPGGAARLQLRFVMASDPYVSFEGIALDDIHIYDNTQGIYDGATMGSPVSQTVAGNNWINFTSGGKLVASIQPNNQNIGATDVQAYIHTGTVRNDANQYYHNRNITNQPTNRFLDDSAAVRFYFLDTETESLINAACSGCSKPAMAYELGIAKYSDINTLENGSITDNTKGIWSFIPSTDAIKVPYDKGYYAEFKTKSFSEFWLKKEAFNRANPPITALSNFRATKQPNNDVLTEWTVTVAGYAQRFEIELARGNASYQLNQFTKIGETISTGTAPQNYQFTDAENNKTGVRYYRLKIVNSDGSFFYSAVRAIVFSDEQAWLIYPNPSAGIFNLVYQKNEGESVAARVYDLYGRLIRQLTFSSNGFIQKATIDLGNPQWGSGLYVVEITSGEKKQVFKLMKQ